MEKIVSWALQIEIDLTAKALRVRKERKVIL